MIRSKTRTRPWQAPTAVATQVETQVCANQKPNGCLVADDKDRLAGVLLNNIPHVRQGPVENSQARLTTRRGVWRKSGELIQQKGGKAKSSFNVPDGSDHP
jgi:hypothetical protein